MSADCDLSGILSRDWTDLHQRTILFRRHFNNTLDQDEVQTICLLLCLRHNLFGYHHELRTAISVFRWHVGGIPFSFPY